MSDIDKLYAAILAQPEEDTPRLMYADALDERAEGCDADRAAFIRAQCAGDESRAQEIFKALGAYRLSGTNPKQWIWPGADYSFSPDYSYFRRGFVGHVWCAIAAWNNGGLYLCERHPIQELSVFRGINDNWQAFAALSGRLFPFIRTLRITCRFGTREAAALMERCNEWKDTLKEIRTTLPDVYARRVLMRYAKKQTLIFGGVDTAVERVTARE